MLFRSSKIPNNENVEVVSDDKIPPSLESKESNSPQEEIDLPENGGLEAPEDTELDNELPTQPIVNEPVPTTTVEPIMITVEIPSGTPGIGIAKILKEKSLIEDTSVFVSRVEERNLAIKLKSGTYKIDSKASLDDIINIITGQKN